MFIHKYVNKKNRKKHLKRKLFNKKAIITKNKKLNTDNHLEIEGLLEPVANNSKDNEFDFQLSSNNHSYKLKVPKRLKNLFKKHVWERLIIKAVEVKKNILKIEKANLIEDESIPVLENFNEKDLLFLKHKINKGQLLHQEYEYEAI